MNRIVVIVLMVAGLSVGFWLAKRDSLGEAATQEAAGKGYTDITVAQLAERLGSGGPMKLVDVREPDEYAQGHIAGAIPIPLGTIGERAGELRSDETIVIICRGGVRSAKAAGILAKKGFTNLFSVLGGMNAWKGTLEYGPPKAGADGV